MVVSAGDTTTRPDMLATVPTPGVIDTKSERKTSQDRVTVCPESINGGLAEKLITAGAPRGTPLFMTS